MGIGVTIIMILIVPMPCMITPFNPLNACRAVHQRDVGVVGCQPCAPGPFKAKVAHHKVNQAMPISTITDGAGS